MPRVVSLHIGRPKGLPQKPSKISAIDKRPVEGPVRLDRDGFEGDGVADLRHHGGPYKAVCAYASEFYPGWRAETGRDMPLGSFGENLALEGLNDEEVCLADVYRLGSARLEVTGPRGPCKTLAQYWEDNSFHLRIKKARRTGFYLRVLEEGEAAAGMALEREERPYPHWNLVRAWEVFDGGAATEKELRELLAMDALDPDWKRRLERRARA